MAIVVLKVVALIFQRLERLIFHLPPRPTTAHELIDVPLAHPQVRHPAEVLDHGLADLPILHEIDPHIRSRGIERYVVHKAKPMHHTRSTVMPLILGHAPGFLSSLHLFEEIRMVACVHPENIVATVIMQRLDVGVVYHQRAAKYQRPAWRPSEGQKGLDERAILSSQRPSHPCGRPRSRPCGRTSSAWATSPGRSPRALLAHTPAGWGHGGTRKSRTSRKLQTWPVNPAAIAGVHGRHCVADPVPWVGRGCGSGWRKEACGRQKL